MAKKNTLKEVETVCPYCGTGCQLVLVVDEEANKILECKPSTQGVNEGKLCLKGHYGWDFLNDPQILTKRLREPMIRKGGKGSPLVEVSWDEAIRFVADNLLRIKKKYGPDAIMGTGSARSTNENNYLMQKFMRACIGTNNIDHCARLCHAASVAGCSTSIGEGAMSLSTPEIEDAEVLLNIGYNSPAAHPLVARRVIKAKEKGAKLICIDPRFTETARMADMFLQIRGGTNLAIVNGLANVIISEDLIDRDFIAEHTKGFDEYKGIIEKYTPEFVSTITRVPADTIRAAGRLFGKSKHSIIMWGMGVTQFTQGVDVVKGICGLLMMTGNFGRPSTGVAPVRGQNNVQGACDMCALPNAYPGYQSVTLPENKAKFEKAWGATLSDQIGLHVTRVPERVLHEPDPRKQIHAYYVYGEDPALSDPNLEEVRECLAKIDFVVLQDIFMNKTGLYADAVLPATGWGEHSGMVTATDRSILKTRKAIEPTGNVKEDWQILSLVSTAMGYPMHYHNAEEIWHEVLAVAPKFAGATYEKVEKYGSVRWPCWTKDIQDTGTQYLHKDGKFALPDGKGVFAAAEYAPVKEMENDVYPIALSNFHEVGHHSMRSMTGNCRTLRNLEDEPGVIEMSLEDAEQSGVKNGDIVRVLSKRGHCYSRCVATGRVKHHTAYMTHQWWIGSVNELTVPYLDPVSRTPEYKYCAIRVEKIADQEWAATEVAHIYQTIRKNMRIDVKEGVDVKIKLPKMHSLIR
ncbi:MAG: formate dehydrogenase subunit alpha [Treponema sp.]|jgi:formate dehydrogenase major subunit|nr:formate dehydrogenase subunit alpha [Treponema sp.]